MNKLYLTEIFASVQGETSLAGLPTTFIRLSGCNLRCNWCDTPYSFPRGEPWSFSAIFDQLNTLGCKYVCVTGGEPLLQKQVHPLMTELCDRDYVVSLETSGSLCIKQVDPRVMTVLDIKCPGSRMESKNHWPNLDILKVEDEIKFVLLDREDFDYALAICHRFGLLEREKAPLFSPAHGQLDPQLLVQWILNAKLPARLNLQQHKYIWAPCTRGV